MDSHGLTQKLNDAYIQSVREKTFGNPPATPNDRGSWDTGFAFMGGDNGGSTTGTNTGGPKPK